MLQKYNSFLKRGEYFTQRANYFFVLEKYNSTLIYPNSVLGTITWHVGEILLCFILLKRSIILITWHVVFIISLFCEIMWQRKIFKTLFCFALFSFQKEKRVLTTAFPFHQFH